MEMSNYYINELLRKVNGASLSLSFSFRLHEWHGIKALAGCWCTALEFPTHQACETGMYFPHCSAILI